MRWGGLYTSKCSETLPQPIDQPFCLCRIQPCEGALEREAWGSRGVKGWGGGWCAVGRNLTELLEEPTFYLGDIYQADASVPLSCPCLPWPADIQPIPEGPGGVENPKEMRQPFFSSYLVAM